MSNPDHLLSAYQYELPSDRIAQNPVVPRDRSRLLAVDSHRNYQHLQFYQLPQLLVPGDLLVLNNTRVLPARLYGHKQSGVPVETLLMEPVGTNRWLALVKPGKRLPVGSTIVFNDEVHAKVVATDPATKGRELQFHLPPGKDVRWALELLGRVPLPPYITHSQVEPEQYQTVYAARTGAIAAPTAGLHFTENLLAELKSMGVAITHLTLHVGLGTFRPVEVDDITTHVMHQEWLEVTAENIEAIQAARQRGGRVIGVGTTVARAIETSGMQPYHGKTSLMIYPGYQWQVLDGLITNFHLPRSSLMMLVASFLGTGGREFLISLYQEAIAAEYRFYSFGDAMFLQRSQ